MGSTRLPGKPLMEIGGRPMILLVAEGCRSGRVDRVVVATDSPRIASVVEAAGVEAVVTGPAESGTRRVHEAWELLGRPGSLIVNVQGDEPMVKAFWIEALLDAPPGPDTVVTLARPISAERARDPSSVKVVIGEDGYAHYFSRLPVPYGAVSHREHLGLYCFSPESLRCAAGCRHTALAEAERLEQLDWLECGMRMAVVTGEFSGSSVDTPEDLEEVRRLLDG